jgi:cytochrome b subunit of formate dehydrogenase
MKIINLILLILCFGGIGGAFAQSSDDCLMCHSEKTLEGRKGNRTISLYVDKVQADKSVHASLQCQDCHQGLNPAELPHAKAIKPVDCQSCHDVGAYDKSVHGRAQAAAAAGKGRPLAKGAARCKDCHGSHSVRPPSDPKSSTNHAHISQTCGECHQQEDAHFSRSAHGLALAQNVKGAPACIDCHGEHNVEPPASKDSPVYKSHEAKVCLKCHQDNPDVRARMGPSAGFVAAYETSAHGVALSAGNENAATCSDCHGAHDMKKGAEPTSLVSKWNIPQTCAKCHADIAKTYNESTHGVALQWGNKDAPGCTDCHGEHNIYGPKDPRSTVAAKNVSAQVCARCHESVKLSQKYGIPSERFQTFADSYHGLAGRAGDVQVANCASCHGYHNIKPSSDPASTIHKANLAATCGQCHPGANDNFAKGMVHISTAGSEEAVLYWIRLFYIWMIVLVIGGMVVHNLLDFVKKSRVRLRIREGKLPEEHFGPTQFVRMTLNERVQHATMFTSFIVLVITGFMLKYPDSWWVAPIRDWSERVFEVRSITHRIAGIVMTAISIYHVFYLAFSARGRRLVADMLPKLRDAVDCWRLLAYNLGLSGAKPLFGRFSYIEKAEYWALAWGVVVMAATGFVMWFDNFFMNLLTKLGWDIARTIHFYEACLATLAIVVWHFYFVMFNPNVYPINTAWWTGKLSEAEMADEHPLELEQIRSEQLAREVEARPAVKAAGR